MQLAYRPTRANAIDLDLNNVRKDQEQLVVSREDGFRQIAELEKRLAGKLSRHVRADLLNRRALIYQALGDPKMLESAEESWRFSKTAIPAFVYGLSLHFHGRLNEAFEYYTRAYKLPHGEAADMEIAFAYVVQFLFRGEWQKVWPILQLNCKRIVYTLRQQNGGILPEWTPESSAREVSIIQEGGYGDIIQYSRYLKYFRENGIKATVYFTPTFFETGFADLFAYQDFGVEIRSAKEIPATVPAVGFLDFNFVFRVNPDTVPTYEHPWRARPESGQKYTHIRADYGINTPYGGTKPLIGICWQARQKENLLCADGVYRTLTEEQARRITQEPEYEWVSLQLESRTPIARNIPFYTWNDTAGLIANCDAVVSVDTAVMHLAAAMGKPTYTLLSGLSEWKFGLPEISGDRCFWYPSMKLFHNQGFGFEQSINRVMNFLLDTGTSL